MTLLLNVPIVNITSKYNKNKGVAFYIMRTVIIVIIVMVIFQIGLLIVSLVNFIYKYFLMKEKDLPKRYGRKSYVVITGTSSGQGYYFAKEMAQRGFNLILILSIVFIN